MIDKCLTDCPHCGEFSESMNPLRTNLDGFYVILSFHCESCDENWDITYKFESVEEL